MEIGFLFWFSVTILHALKGNVLIRNIVLLRNMAWSVHLPFFKFFQDLGITLVRSLDPPKNLPMEFGKILSHLPFTNLALCINIVPRRI